jgi:hypothetical protein
MNSTDVRLAAGAADGSAEPLRFVPAISRHRGRELLLVRICQKGFALTNTKVNLKVAGPNEFPAKVVRPKYSALENRALASRGLNVFKSWRDGLREYLGQFAH